MFVRAQKMILSFTIGALFSHCAMAHSGDTTAYYQTYNNHITGRTFISNKFTSFRLRSDNYSYFYRPITSYNLGLGFTYEWLTLNFGYGFDFLNPHRDKKDTRSIDLQFHPYGRKLAIDVLGQFYRGYKLNSPEEIIRKDVRVTVVGATVQYIFNHDRFSYRAAFLQSEWQKRSAGSWLAGVEFYTGRIRADSSMVPGANVPLEEKLRSSSFVELGPNVGYAYTYVYREHFFVTGSASVSFDLGFNTTISAVNKEKGSGFSPNTLFKFFGGYNSSKWAVTAIYLYNSQHLVSNLQNQVLSLHSGNFRIHFAYRFKPGKRARQLLKPLDDIKKIDG